jgi:hypothetical protein
MASGVCDYLSVWICVNNMAVVTLWVHHGHAHLRPFCVARHARHAHGQIAQMLEKPPSKTLAKTVRKGQQENNNAPEAP